MNEKDWERFFTLVDRIVDMGGTADEKAQLFRAKAKEHGSDVNVGEIAAWCEDGIE